MLNWNLAEEYAKRFNIQEKTSIEDDWQFRERVARSLAEMDKRLLAHEVLYNQRMSETLFTRGELSSGYDDTFITLIAKQTEAAFQQQRKQREHRHRQDWLFTIIHSWRTLGSR